MDETELLKRIQTLSQHANKQQSQLYAPGNDCALLDVADGKALVVSTDIYVSGIHFPPQLDTESIAWHCLVGAISDLAASGAEPLALTLAVSAEHADWINALLPHCFKVGTAYQMRLIGGDISQGPTSLCVTVFGQTRADEALSRSNAQPDDDIWVSGYLGEAAAGLKILIAKLAEDASGGDRRGEQPTGRNVAHRQLTGRFCRPNARINLGMALQGIASAAIDVSDGLLADLDKLLTASCYGAEIDHDALPISAALQAYALKQDQDALKFVCSGGDDYELCFTAPPDLRPKIELIAKQLKLQLSPIGKVVRELGLRSRNGGSLPIATDGWQHFAGTAQSA